MSLATTLTAARRGERRRDLRVYGDPRSSRRWTPAPGRSSRADRRRLAVTRNVSARSGNGLTSRTGQQSRLALGASSKGARWPGRRSHQQRSPGRLAERACRDRRSATRAPPYPSIRQDRAVSRLVSGSRPDLGQAYHDPSSVHRVSAPGRHPNQSRPSSTVPHFD